MENNEVFYEESTPVLLINYLYEILLTNQSHSITNHDNFVALAPEQLE